MGRPTVAALVVGMVVLALSGCAAAQQPEAAQPTTSAPPPTPSSTGPSAQELAAMRAARKAVSDRMIMQQLRDAAERIAKQEPLKTPVPTPADIDPGSNRALGYQLMLDFGFAAKQWAALDALWTRESGWNHLAENKSSGAYGIPQSLPANKMAVVGADYRTNPETQIRWGLAYIAARYGVPDQAWAHSERHGWY